MAVIFAGLWRRSELETQRAEASKLVALAQVRLQADPTEALAYTTASLEVADTPAARTFAMRALWEAPPALVLESPGTDLSFVRFSPEGERIAFSGFTDAAGVWSDTGQGPIVLRGLEKETTRGRNTIQWISEEVVSHDLPPGWRSELDRPNETSFGDGPEMNSLGNLVPGP